VTLAPEQGMGEALAYAGRILLRFLPAMGQLALGVAFLVWARAAGAKGDPSDARVRRPAAWTLVATLVTLTNAVYVLTPLVGSVDPITFSYVWVRDDLRNLAAQQEHYFTSHRAYSANLRELGFVPSEGNTVSVDATDAGWTAVADRVTGMSCSIFWGEVQAARATAWGAVPSQPGEMVCDGIGGRGALEGYKRFLRRLGR
jgi:hypothetical protein